MERAARQLLRAIRGPRSQAAFSRWLGYHSNVVAEWERGRRFPTADEALRAAARARIDVPAAFESFHADAARQLGGADAAGVARWLDDLRRDIPAARVAQRTGRSRYAVHRWLTGQARPRLPDFLRLVDALTGRAPELVAALVPIEQVPSLEARFRALDVGRRIGREEPWAEALLLLLYTDRVRSLARHEPGFLAAILGISTDDEQRCLDLLQRAGVVRLRGERYEIGGALSADSRGDPAVMAGIKCHWLEVARSRIAAPDPGDMFGYNLMALSHDDLERVRQLYQSFFRQVREVVAASEPVQTLALLQLQLLGWDPPGE